MKPTMPVNSSTRPPSRARSAYARQRVKESNPSMQYRDTSIFGATRQKEEEDHKLQKTQQSLNKQSAIFANEVKKLRERQGKLAKAQQRMATTVSPKA